MKPFPLALVIAIVRDTQRMRRSTLSQLRDTERVMNLSWNRPSRCTWAMWGFFDPCAADAGLPTVSDRTWKSVKAKPCNRAHGRIHVVVKAYA